MKDVPGYEGLYGVTSCGKVWSYKNKKFLKPVYSRDYQYVRLYKKGKAKWHTIHYLVALVYVNNPNNYKEVNHKDENKENNFIKNLEWCTRSYNINYGTRNQRVSESVKKAIERKRNYEKD